MQWLPPFGDDRASKVIYENPTRMTGARFSPDGQILFFTERGQRDDGRVPERHGDEVHVIARGGGGGAARRRSIRRRRRRGGGQARPRRGGGGGGNAARSVRRRWRRRRPGRRWRLAAAAASAHARAALGRRHQRVLPGHAGRRPRHERGTGAREHVHRQGRHQDRRADARSSRATRADLTEIVSRPCSIRTRRSSSSARQNATTPPQQFLCDNGDAQAADEQRGSVPGPDAHGHPALQRSRGRTASRSAPSSICRPTTRKARGCRASSGSTRRSSRRRTQYDSGRTAAAPRRARRRRRSRTSATLSMQFLVRLGYAVVENDAPIVGPAGQMNNNYVNDLRNDLAATIDELDKRQLIDRTAAGDRRPQLRRVLDRQRDGQHAVLQGRHRGRRRLQPHADADRLPERAARPVGGAERVPRHVAVPHGQPPDRRAADVSRPRATRTSAPIRSTRCGCSTR